MDLGSIQKRLVQSQDVAATLRELAPAICEAFGADRMTVYRCTDSWLEAVLQTGLETSSAIKIPRRGDERWDSVAAYVAWNLAPVNVVDGYDKDELARFRPPMGFFRKVDERTGYRTRQVLAAPVVSSDGKALGVVQLLNRGDDKPFPAECGDGIALLCAAIGEAWTGEPCSPREDLWMAQRDCAPDAAFFMREWLAVNPDPAGTRERIALAIGTALMEGAIGTEPDRNAALRWYAQALRAHSRSVPAAFAGPELFKIGASLETAERPLLAMEWYEAGFMLGHEESLRRWLRLAVDQRTGGIEQHLTRALCFYDTHPGSPGRRDRLERARALCKSNATLGDIIGLIDDAYGERDRPCE